MIRSCLVCFTLIAVCAHASAQSTNGTGTASADSVTSSLELAQAAGSAQPTPASPATPEAKAAAVPVDREALLSPADVPVPAPRDIEQDPLFVPGAVLIGTGGAALLASLFTGLGAHGIYGSLEDDCKNDICRSEDQHRIDSGKTLAVVSTVLTGVGIAAAGVGTVFMVLAATREDEPPAQVNFGIAKLRLTGGPTPLGVGAAGSF
jgi:hypothetical protein